MSHYCIVWVISGKFGLRRVPALAANAGNGLRLPPSLACRSTPVWRLLDLEERADRGVHFVGVVTTWPVRACFRSVLTSSPGLRCGAQGEWVGLAGQGGQRQCDFLEAGPGVDDGRTLGVPGVGAGDGGAEVAFHPFQGRVLQPVWVLICCFSTRGNSSPIRVRSPSYRRRVIGLPLR